jgi:hypothetical protein
VRSILAAEARSRIAHSFWLAQQQPRMNARSQNAFLATFVASAWSHP